MRLIHKYLCWMVVVIFITVLASYKIVPFIIFVVAVAITPMVILLIRDKHK